MKIPALALFAVLAVAVSTPAADVALIYTSSQSISTARSWPALLTPAGAAVPADVALSSPNSLLYGNEDGLFRASIARLDTDTNLAVIRPGERVGHADAQAAHAGRWRATLTLLNLSTAAAAPAVAAAPGVVTVAPVPGGENFVVRINGVEDTTEPLVLKERFKKSRFKLEVVNTSTVPVWNVEVKVKANPELSFWKEGRRTDLNDVPEKTFVYRHQTVFKPLKAGEKFTVPVEIYFIKERDYVWDISVASKSTTVEKKFLVRFE